MPKRMNDVDVHVARRIRERRREIGMSQEQLGDALGVRHWAIHRYESGTDRVSVGRLYELAQGLRVTVGYFFKGAGSPVQPIPESAGRHDRQLVALVNSFTQISSSTTRSAILRHVRAMAAEDAQAKLRRKPRPKD